MSSFCSGACIDAPAPRPNRPAIRRQHRRRPSPARPPPPRLCRRRIDRPARRTCSGSTVDATTSRTSAIGRRCGCPRATATSHHHTRANPPRRSGARTRHGYRTRQCPPLRRRNRIIQSKNVFEIGYLRSRRVVTSSTADSPWLRCALCSGADSLLLSGAENDDDAVTLDADVHPCDGRRRDVVICSLPG